jgi:hypothetical protein
LNTYDQVVDLYNKKNILDKVLKNENLNDELRDVALGELSSFFDGNLVNQYHTSSIRKNESTAGKDISFSLNAQNRPVFEEKERFLLENFYK